MSKRKAKPPLSREQATKNVDRLLAILDWLSRQRGNFTVKQLAEGVGLSYQTAWRWVRAIESREWVSKRMVSVPSRTAGSGYRLRSHVSLRRRK